MQCSFLGTSISESDLDREDFEDENGEKRFEKQNVGKGNPRPLESLVVHEAEGVKALTAGKDFAKEYYTLTY